MYKNGLFRTIELLIKIKQNMIRKNCIEFAKINMNIELVIVNVFKIF